MFLHNTLRCQLFAGTFLWFCNFVHFVVLNCLILVIFIMVCSQYLIVISINSLHALLIIAQAAATRILKMVN